MTVNEDKPLMEDWSGRFNNWWAYRHVTGSLQVKRFFSDIDIIDARESDFVSDVAGPFFARDRAHAVLIAEERLGFSHSPVFHYRAA